MVAYSYKARFVAPIRVGLDLPTLAEHLEMGGYHPGQIIRPKRQTIVKGKRRHARPGETLQHYHGIDRRVLQDREAECVAASDIRLHIRSEIIEIRSQSSSSRLIDKAAALDSFAQADGFADWADMREFWREEHGDLARLGPFVGVLVEWKGKP
jgi:hypothetical protein